jgi:hypothetical protein
MAKSKKPTAEEIEQQNQQALAAENAANDLENQKNLLAELKSTRLGIHHANVVQVFERTIGHCSFPMSEATVLELCKNETPYVGHEFVYVDAERKKGYINLTEFGKTLRCPLEGFFDFEGLK